jgi:omega-amidase
MQDLAIALVQAEQLWEDKPANFSNYEALLSSISAVDLILLPEMFQTSFSMKPAQFAEPMNESIGINWLRKMAAEKNAAFYTSLMIEDQGKYYNRGVFMFPSGEYQLYDKRKLFGMAREEAFFTAGDKACIVTYKEWKIQLQICYDLRFPELSRNSLIDDAPAYDLLLYVANWPEKRSAHWKALLQARAIENQAYVAGVNRVGTDGLSLTYSGDSAVISPLGEVSSLEKYAEEVKIVTLSYSQKAEVLNTLPFLKDR